MANQKTATKNGKVVTMPTRKAKAFVTDVLSTEVFMAIYRKKYREGKLSPSIIARLEEIQGWSWTDDTYESPKWVIDKLAGELADEVHSAHEIQVRAHAELNRARNAGPSIGSPLRN